MGRLIGYMANRKDRLGGVLDQEHDAIAPGEDFRPGAWGIGFYQGGEVLHKKRPQLDEGPIDWEKVARGVRSDAVIIHFRNATVGDYRSDNTHPFRMRQWLFAHVGTVEGFEAIRASLLEALPDYLRRNIRGSTDSEHLFVVLLSFLHDAGQLDHPDADEEVVLGALRSTHALVSRHCEEVGAPRPTLNLLLTNGLNLYALRQGGPMYYVERDALPSGPPKVGSMRYVLVYSNGDDTPPGYEELPEGSVLTVDRNLKTAVQPL
jgi:predicted glutamine amidotransferase